MDASQEMTIVASSADSLWRPNGIVEQQATAAIKDLPATVVLFISARKVVASPQH
jgi:hypothetical protein